MSLERVAIDPSVQHGKPIIRGTRVPVGVLVGSVAAGMTVEETALEYVVEVEDVRAALEYASRIVSDEDVEGLHA